LFGRSARQFHLGNINVPEIAPRMPQRWRSLQSTNEYNRAVDRDGAECGDRVIPR
jgi:hypothetical protein